MIGQGGKGHVNEKSREEVVKLFADLGYVYQDKLSTAVRTKARHYWFRNTFMVFKNSKHWFKNIELCSGANNPSRRKSLVTYLNDAGLIEANGTTSFWEGI